MLESKIAMTRNLLLFVILLCIALGAVVIYQGQEIKKTRETLNSMQRQAENAVGQFMPQLNNRLNRFDTRLDEFQGKMDKMDENMKHAEDRFVARMNTEMPKKQKQLWKNTGKVVCLFPVMSPMKNLMQKPFPKQ